MATEKASEASSGPARMDESSENGTLPTPNAADTSLCSATRNESLATQPHQVGDPSTPSGQSSSENLLSGNITNTLEKSGVPGCTTHPSRRKEVVRIKSEPPDNDELNVPDKCSLDSDSRSCVTDSAEQTRERILPEPGRILVTVKKEPQDASDMATAQPQQNQEPPQDLVVAEVNSTANELESSPSVSPTQRVFKCGLCAREFTSSAVRDYHEQDHSNAQYQCCGYFLEDFSVLARHVKNFHNQKMSESDAEQYRINQNKHHPEVRTKIQETLNESQPSTSVESSADTNNTADGTSQKDKFCCSYCGRIFKSRAVRNRHQVNHHLMSYRCPCGFLFIEFLFQQKHMKKHGETISSEDSSKYEIRRQISATMENSGDSHLEAKKKWDAGNRLKRTVYFKCPENCSYTATDFRRFRDHYRVEHKKERRDSDCLFKTLFAKSQEELEVERAWMVRPAFGTTGGRNGWKRKLRCRHCRRQFRTRINQIRHEIKHRDMKFVCFVSPCASQFLDISGLDAHLRHIHPEESLQNITFSQIRCDKPEPKRRFYRRHRASVPVVAKGPGKTTGGKAVGVAKATPLSVAELQNWTSERKCANVDTVAVRDACNGKIQYERITPTTETRPIKNNVALLCKARSLINKSKFLLIRAKLRKAARQKVTVKRPKATVAGLQGQHSKKMESHAEDHFSPVGDAKKEPPRADERDVAMRSGEKRRKLNDQEFIEMSSAALDKTTNWASPSPQKQRSGNNLGSKTGRSVVRSHDAISEQAKLW